MYKARLDNKNTRSWIVTPKSISRCSFCPFSEVLCTTLCPSGAWLLSVVRSTEVVRFYIGGSLSINTMLNFNLCHRVCPLYRGCPLLGVSAMGGSIVYIHGSVQPNDIYVVRICLYRQIRSEVCNILSVYIPLLKQIGYFTKINGHVKTSILVKIFMVPNRTTKHISCGTCKNLYVTCNPYMNQKHYTYKELHFLGCVPLTAEGKHDHVTCQKPC